MKANKEYKAYVHHNSVRLSNRRNQVVKLEHSRIAGDAVVTHIYTTRGKTTGSYYDFGRSRSRQVRLIKNECWTLRG